MQQLALTVTFCYQFSSQHYDKVELHSCIARAIEEVDRGIDGINVVYDPIEEGLSSEVIHENITKTIQKSNLVIFELSDLNPNVLFELGLAKGRDKPIIVLREEGVEKPLPTDVQSFIYLKYSKNNLQSLHFSLAQKIKKTISNVSPTDLIPSQFRDEILRTQLVPLRSKDDFSDHLARMIDQTQCNLYFIGTMGNITKNESWIVRYKEKLKDKVFCRITFLKTLREFHEIYGDMESLEDYCLWLIQTYHLVDHKVISLYTNENVGVWRMGLSLVISDENQTLISTGQFGDFNNKGIFINNKSIGTMFKEYAKMLAISSREVKLRQLAKCFDIEETATKPPLALTEHLEPFDFQKLKESCSNYLVKHESEL